MSTKKSSLSKKLEQFKRTQEINALVHRGAIEEDAILDSSSDAKPAEESHAYDLLEVAEQQKSARSAKKANAKASLSKAKILKRAAKSARKKKR